MVRWSALGLVMIESQMTALLLCGLPSLVKAAGVVQSAVTYTKICFVFHVKRDERSASSENLMMAYSSLRDE